jgi:hypothetical protein
MKSRYKQIIYVAQLVKELPAVNKPEGAVPCSQQPNICPYSTHLKLLDSLKDPSSYQPFIRSGVSRGLFPNLTSLHSVVV